MEIKCQRFNYHNALITLAPPVMPCYYLVIPVVLALELSWEWILAATVKLGADVLIM